MSDHCHNRTGCPQEDTHAYPQARRIDCRLSLAERPHAVVNHVVHPRRFFQWPGAEKVNLAVVADATILNRPNRAKLWVIIR